MYLIDDLKSAHPLELIFRLMIAGVGLLLLGFAGWMVLSNLVIIGTHEKAYAEVVSSQRNGPASSKGLSSYNVRLKFETNGKIRNVELGRSNTHYDVGEVIPIYYKGDTAYTAVAGDFFGMWFFVLVIAVPGAIALFFAFKPDSKKTRVR